MLHPVRVALGEETCGPVKVRPWTALALGPHLLPPRALPDSSRDSRSAPLTRMRPASLDARPVRPNEDARLRRTSPAERADVARVARYGTSRTEPLGSDGSDGSSGSNEPNGPNGYWRELLRKPAAVTPSSAGAVRRRAGATEQAPAGFAGWVPTLSRSRRRLSGLSRRTRVRAKAVPSRGSSGPRGKGPGRHVEEVPGRAARSRWAADAPAPRSTAARGEPLGCAA